MRAEALSLDEQHALTRGHDESGHSESVHGACAHGEIGPNAVIRVADVLREENGEDAATAIFTAAGLSRYLAAMPDRMIDEAEVTALHAVLRDRLGLAAARHVGWQAGIRTGDYLLANRIPAPVQLLLKCLPSRLASRILLQAIGRNAWTFAGSGAFRVEAGPPLRLVIDGGPVCRGVHADEPVCDFYAATFERLYRALVNPRTRVREVACEAGDAPACVFEVRW